MLYPFFRNETLGAIASVLNGCTLALMEGDTDILIYPGLTASVASNDTITLATAGAVATAIADASIGINRFQIRGGAFTVAPVNQDVAESELNLPNHGIPVDYPQPCVISGGIPATVPPISEGSQVWIAYKTHSIAELQYHDGTQSTVGGNGGGNGYNTLNITAAAPSDTTLTPVLIDYRNEIITVPQASQTPGEKFAFYTANSRTLQQGEFFVAAGNIPSFNPPIGVGQALWVNTNNDLRGHNFAVKTSPSAPNADLTAASTGDFEMHRPSAVGDSSSQAIIKLNQVGTQILSGTQVTFDQNTVFHVGRSAIANIVYF